MSKRDYHVVPNGSDGWAVRREGGERATSVHPTQAAAIDAARQHATHSGTEVVIHRPNGQIRDSDSYGHDPRSSRDTKH